MSKIRINVEEVKQLIARRREINNISLVDIEWIEGGEVVNPPAGAVEDWVFTGLSNFDFVDIGFYNGTDETETTYFDENGKPITTGKQE